jgi:hypothetical protein
MIDEIMPCEGVTLQIMKMCFGAPNEDKSQRLGAEEKLQLSFADFKECLDKYKDNGVIDRDTYNAALELGAKAANNLPLGHTLFFKPEFKIAGLFVDAKGVIDKPVGFLPKTEELEKEEAKREKEKMQILTSPDKLKIFDFIFRQIPEKFRENLKDELIGKVLNFDVSNATTFKKYIQELAKKGMFTGTMNGISREIEKPGDEKWRDAEKRKYGGRELELWNALEPYFVGSEKNMIPKIVELVKANGAVGIDSYSMCIWGCTDSIYNGLMVL